MELELLAQSHTTTETTVFGSGPVHFNTAAPSVCVICNAVDSLKDCLCLIVTQSFFFLCRTRNFRHTISNKIDGEHVLFPHTKWHGNLTFSLMNNLMGL